MSETDSSNGSSGPSTPTISDLYAEANKLNASLSSKYDGGKISQGKQIAAQLIEHVKANVEDYKSFVETVERSELFALHDSAQVDKKQRQFKLYYERAVSLLETIEQSESRRK